MFVRLLGIVGIGEDEADVLAAPGATARAVLSTLAAAAGRAVTKDQIATATWDVAPPSAVSAINVAISRLRKAYGHDVVETVVGGYRINATLARIDLLEFESKLDVARAKSRSGKHVEALAESETALSLLTGEALAGQTTAWADRVRDRVAEAESEVSLIRASALSALGRYPEAVEILTRLRRAAPLDEAIACSLMTALAGTGRLSDALREYGALRSRLAAELGVDPSPKTQLLFRQLLDPPSLKPFEIKPIIRLPLQAGPTIGRESAVTSIATLLDEHQVVSIVGPGGIGKTRVAIACAKKFSADHAYSAWFVDLTSAQDSQSFHSALTDSIDAEGAPHLEVLEYGRHLVILDNVEHVAEFAEEFIERMLVSDQVKIIATSRVALEVRQECLYWLRELDCGELESPATELFMEHARNWIDVELIDRRVATELARKVDGVPLALELLAAGLRWMTPEELLQDVARQLLSTSRLRRLPTRHRSATVAIEWNLGQVGSADHLAMQALCVFRGAFPLTAAERVIDGITRGRTARDHLATLVDLSLVQRVTGPGDVRLRVLEPVRIAILEMPRTETVEQRAALAHSCFYIQRVVDAVELDEGRDRALLTLCADDDRNVDQAIDWMWNHDRSQAASALGHFLFYWNFVEHHDRLEEWKPRVASGALHPLATAHSAVALYSGAVFRGQLGEADRWRSLIEPQEAQLLEPWSSVWWYAQCEYHLVNGEIEAAVALLSAAPAARDTVTQASRTADLGVCQLAAGNFDEALARFREALSLGDLHGDPRLLLHILADHAYASVIVGELDGAYQSAQKAVALADATGLPRDFVRSSLVLGWVFVERDEPLAALNTAAASAEALALVDDRLFQVEAATIGALALLALGERSAAAIALSTVAHLLTQAPPGLLDPWASERIASLLAAHAAPTLPMTLPALAQALGDVRARLATDA